MPLHTIICLLLQFGGMAEQLTRTMKWFICYGSRLVVSIRIHVAIAMRSPQRGADRHRNGNRRRHATPRTEAQALPSPRAQLRHGPRRGGARWRAIPSGGRRGWCPCRLPPMGHTDTCQSRQSPCSSRATPVHKEPGSHARSNGAQGARVRSSGRMWSRPEPPPRPSPPPAPQQA